MPDDNTATTPTTPTPDPSSPVLPTVAAPDSNSTNDQTVPPAESMPTIPAEPAPAEPIPAEPASDVNPAPTTPTPVPAPADQTAPADSPIVDPTIPPADETATSKPAKTPTDKSLYPEIAAKIRDARNVLVALSSDPSVDEMAAAIGLSLYLDRLGKRATAIYSGATPNALEFLKPEETFESTADTLQDFVIALNKEKADHLRYKLDGDFVKIYITPYKTRISEEDLDFSYGDYNVDLVFALDVANGIDLDAALREHGRIMHDAVIINVTTGNPGKFGEIEWSDKSASSVSEMIANLLYGVESNIKIEKEEATAFLTGIVAATNRFSNASTTPETMQTASKLMKSGANQQLVSKNITPDLDNQLFSLTKEKVAESEKASDPTQLEIQHEGEPKVDEKKEVGGTVTEKAHTLLDDLKAAEESLATAGAETTPVADHKTLKIDSSDEKAAPEPPKEESSKEETPEKEAPEEESSKEDKPAEESEVKSEEAPKLNSETESSSETTPPAEESDPNAPILEAPSFDDFVASNPALSPESGIEDKTAETTIQPPTEINKDFTSEDSSNKYGHMLEDALNSLNEPSSTSGGLPDENPATMTAPTVASNPEINGVPEMNYMPMPDEEILPPPPTPVFDPDSLTPPDTTTPPVEPIAPAAPAEESAPAPLGPQPAMQDQVYNPQTADPGAFKIPGM